MTVDFLLISSVPGLLEHEPRDHISILDKIHDQGEEVISGGAPAPPLLIDVSDEADASGPDDVVADEVKGAVQIGCGEAKTQHRIRQEKGFPRCID